MTKRIHHVLGLLALAAVVFTSSVRAATHTWTGAGGNKLFSNPANWAGNNVPANSVNYVELIFPVAGTADAIVDIQNLTVNAVTIQRTSFTLMGTNSWPLTLAAFVSWPTITTYGGPVTFASSLRLAFPTSLELQATGTVQMASQLIGPGWFRQTGPTDLTLGGSAANTYTNFTQINGATLRLAKPSGVIAVPTDLQMQGGQIILTNSHQINSNALVKFNNSSFRGGAYHQILKNIQAANFVTLNSASGGVVTVGNVSCQSIGTELDLEGYGGTISLAGTFSLGRNTETYLWGNISLAVPPPGERGATFYLDDSGNTVSLPFVRIIGNISGPTNAPIRYTGRGTIDLWNDSSTYQGPTYVETNVTVSFESAEGFGSGVGGTYVSELALVFFDGPFSLSEPFHLTGPTNYASDMLINYVDALTLTWPIRVTNQVGLLSQNTNGFIISGTVSGPGTITKISSFGDDPLIFNGTAINTFSGGLIVESGVVELRRVNGGLPVPGPLTIFNGSTVRSYFNHQIGDNADVRVLLGSFLRLENVFDTIRSLELLEGNVLTGTGALTVTSNITSLAGSIESFISGNLGLGANGTTIHVESGGSPPDLLVPAVISGSAFATLTKTGAGQLDLVGANTFLGNCFVNGGTLRARNGQALGSTTLGTTVSSNAFLDFNTVSPIHGENLSLNDGTLRFTQPVTNTWGGPVSVGGFTTIETLLSNSRLLLTNIVSGAGGFAKTGLGILDLTGVSANTYAGSTVVSGGVLNLSKTNGPAVPGSALNIGYAGRDVTSASVESLRAAQVGDSTAVALSSLATWDLNGQNDTIGSLAGAGTVSLGLAQLTHGSLGTDTAFSGLITGNASISLVKVGAGVFTMTGVQTYTGRTTVSGGTLLVNGTNGPGLTVVSGGTLAGRGQIGNLTAQGGTLSPGNSPGILKIGNLIGNPNTTYRCELNNTNAGTGYDQLSITGWVQLGGSPLQLVLGNAGAVSNRYTILVNDGTEAITNTFSGLSEGVTFYASGTPFRITYQGGTGNDVVLTQLGLQQKPQIGTIKKLPNGQIEINGTGVPNLLYSVFASTNVALPSTNWLDLGFIQATPSGALQFVDPDATNFVMRFYQFVLPPFNQ
jgi:fibronectin-binding autotransporter adhesin